MKIAICEDENLALKTISTEILSGFKKLGIECAADSFLNPEKLFSEVSAGTTYDVFFLDIEMPGINGIDLSKEIRFYLPKALIVFISNKEELVFQTFTVRPFRFIRKNHFRAELPAVLRDLARECNLEKGPTIAISEPGGKILSISLDDIVYVEAMRKDCVVHRKTDVVVCRYKFSDFCDMLKPYSFVLAHRSYLANCKYIFRINPDTIIFDNKESIPLGRTHRDAVKKGFIDYSKSL